MTAADCGAAALAMVLAYHGRHVALDELRRALQSGRRGASATALLDTAADYGLRGRCVSVDVEDLTSLGPGTILHWQFRHFVVFERMTGTVVEIADPAAGYRRVPVADFGRAFTGVVMTFEPVGTFVRTGSRRRRIWLLFGQMLEQRGTIARLIGVSALVQLLSAALPLLTGVLIDRVVPRHDYSLLLVLAASFAGLQCINACSGFVREHLAIHLRTRLEATFTLRFLDHLIDLPFEFFQQRRSGDLMMRLGANGAVRDILSSTLLSAVLDGLMASIYLALLVLFSVPLTLLVLLLTAVRLSLLALQRWKQRRLLAEGLENQARSQTAQVEMLGTMETLKIMGLERRAAETWSNVFVDGLNVSIRRGRLDAAFNAAIMALSTVSTLLLMFYGAHLVLAGEWTLGSMMAFSALAGGFLGPLNNLMSSALQLQTLEVYLDRLDDVWRTRREQEGEAVSPAAPLVGAVTLEGVSFHYAAAAPAVLKDVSFSIPAGARVAIVGPTGSGKSTLARLIAGLYEPGAGRVLLDGRDFRALERRSVRRQLGVVTQDPQLFGGSIKRNIAFADPSMDFDRVVAAAKLACIHDDIMAMPMTYDTTVADRGFSLSGGQRQRLAIARALACQPRVLLLDEATSHLDSVTEERVIANLATLRCTTIVIAHRLSTVQDASLILVLDGGRVVEAGDHDVLTERGGKYAELIAAQRAPRRTATRVAAIEAL